MRNRIPNALTLARAVLVPVLVVLLAVYKYRPDPILLIAATSIFVGAVITDWLDGALARKWHVVSRFGKLVDPLADKLINMAALVMFADLHWLAGWIVVLALARETTVNTLRMLALSEGTVIAAMTGGKAKTVMQFAGIFLILCHPFVAVPGVFEAGQWAIYASVALAWVSGIEYFVAYFRPRDEMA